MKKEKRFVVLSGPSCAGKGPLQDAVSRFYPDLLAAKPVLCHSRPPRIKKGEIHGQHYYFLPSALISSFQDNPNFAASMVRSDWQAIDLLQIEDLLSGNDIVFAEVFHTFGEILRNRLASRGFTLYSIFLLPLPLETKDQVVIETMREKLTNRGTDKEPKLSERAKSAPEEMRSAQSFTHRILNSATEDDTAQWGEFGTQNGKSGERKIETLDDLGNNAKWLVETFVKVVKGKIPSLPPDKPFLSPEQIA